MKKLVRLKFTTWAVLALCLNGPLGFADNEPSQVELESKFVETHNHNNALGVDFHEPELGNRDFMNARNLAAVDRAGNPMNAPQPMDSFITPSFGGSNLSLVPQVSPNNPNRIQMVAKPETSSMPDQRVAPSSSKLVRIPESRMSAFPTEAGPDVKDASSGERKVPVLSSIPLIGRLFRSKSKSQEKKDLIIQTNPRLVRISE